MDITVGPPFGSLDPLNIAYSICSCVDNKRHVSFRSSQLLADSFGKLARKCRHQKASRFQKPEKIRVHKGRSNVQTLQSLPRSHLGSRRARRRATTRQTLLRRSSVRLVASRSANNDPRLAKLETVEWCRRLCCVLWMEGCPHKRRVCPFDDARIHVSALILSFVLFQCSFLRPGVEMEIPHSSDD